MFMFLGLAAVHAITEQTSPSASSNTVITSTSSFDTDIAGDVTNWVVHQGSNYNFGLQFDASGSRVIAGGAMSSFGRGSGFLEAFAIPEEPKQQQEKGEQQATPPVALKSLWSNEGIYNFLQASALNETLSFLQLGMGSDSLSIFNSPQGLDSGKVDQVETIATQEIGDWRYISAVTRKQDGLIILTYVANTQPFALTTQIINPGTGKTVATLAGPTPTGSNFVEVRVFYSSFFLLLVFLLMLLFPFLSAVSFLPSFSDP